KEIMQGDDFVGYLPSNPQWSMDNETLYFDWNPDGAYSDSLYAYQLKKSKIQKSDFETGFNLPPSRGTLNKDKSLKLYSKRGDIFILNLKTRAITQITDTEEYEDNPHFTENGARVAYVRGNNLYSWSISDGSTVQLTNFKTKESEKKKSIRNEWL